jgi:tRNA A37 methylthiotransferase MiaB
MQRGYTVKDFVHIVDGFRQRISRLTLATDVIVGFPGETERDFIQTLRLIRQVQPDVTNLSRFGPRAGTPAAHMAQLDGTTIKRRSKTAYRVIRQIALTRLKSWVGWTGEVLINERGDGVWWARNFAYRPLAIPSRKNLFGKWVKVKVVNMARGRLVGRLAR